MHHTAACYVPDKILVNPEPKSDPEALRSLTVPLDTAGTSGFGACWHSVNGIQGGFVQDAVYATDTSRVLLGLSDNKTDHLLSTCADTLHRHHCKCNALGNTPRSKFGDFAWPFADERRQRRSTRITESPILQGNASVLVFKYTIVSLSSLRTRRTPGKQPIKNSPEGNRFQFQSRPYWLGLCQTN